MNEGPPPNRLGLSALLVGIRFDLLPVGDRSLRPKLVQQDRERHKHFKGLATQREFTHLWPCLI